jgi:hypothetical protein
MIPIILLAIMLISANYEGEIQANSKPSVEVQTGAAIPTEDYRKYRNFVLGLAPNPSQFPIISTHEHPEIRLLH